MAQMGHTSSALALEVCTKVMERKRDTGERLDALIRGATNGEIVAQLDDAAETQNPAGAGLS
jgi:hypothetical protein